MVEALPAYDSTQDEYWGIDTRSGQRLWQYALKGEQKLTYHDVHATSARNIFVIQCREKGDCSWAIIDPKTGVGSHSGTEPAASYFYPAWFRDSRFLGNGDLLMVVNTVTGKLLYQWP